MICERCKDEIEAADAISDPAALVADLKIGGLQSVSVEKRADLPHLSALYFAVSESGVCYVGATLELDRRWNHHPQLTRLRQEQHGLIAWLPLPSRHLKAAEDAAIRRFKPLWNRGGAQQLSDPELRKQFPIKGRKRGSRRSWESVPPLA